MSQLNREIFKLREDVFHEDERRASATAKTKQVADLLALRGWVHSDFQKEKELNNSSLEESIT